jgi:glycosyltransferase involved in cell wall biosynthesis
MIDNKSISAVLFVFNEERFLSEMLDSILHQTILVDRIIVIDDHSTDGTRKVVERYQQEHTHISYALSKRKGKAYALETGLEKVSTDLFFVCAGDDKLLPHFVAYLYGEMLLKHDIRYCYAKYIICNENLEKTATLNRKLFYNDEEVLFRNSLSGYLFGYSTIIRDFLPLPANLDFEDWYIVMCLTFKYKRSYISEQPVFLYRRHGKSTTTTLGSRAKYLGLIQRDIRFFSRINEFAFTVPEDKKKIINSRVRYLEALVDFSFRKSLGLLGNDHIKAIEKIKLLVFPVFLRLKYRLSKD